MFQKSRKIVYHCCFEITLSALILPHLCACPKLGPRFAWAYEIVFFVFKDLSCEVVDIGGIVNHHWLSFLFIKFKLWHRIGIQNCILSSTIY